jgi:hypothetical protein
MSWGMYGRILRELRRKEYEGEIQEDLIHKYLERQNLLPTKIPL